jgi:hypothetical protein
LDADKGDFRVSAIIFLRQRTRDFATMRNLSITCGSEILNRLIFLSHDGPFILSSRRTRANLVQARTLWVNGVDFLRWHRWHNSHSLGQSALKARNWRGNCNKEAAAA